MFTLFKRIRSEKGDLLPNLKSENFMGSQAQHMIILGAWHTVFFVSCLTDIACVRHLSAKSLS